MQECHCSEPLEEPEVSLTVEELQADSSDDTEDDEATAQALDVTLHALSIPEH